MKRLLLVVAATALLVAPSLGQTQSGITIPEFRQALVDLGSWIDARKGTDFARQFQAIDDDMLMKLYPAVPNTHKFQRLVAQLKQQKFGMPSGTQAKPNFGGVTPLIVYTDPTCANSIIANSPAPCNPAYPDPTDAAWQTMVSPLEGYTDPNNVPAFSPNDDADVSMQGCSLDAEVTLQQINVILSAVVNSAAPFCNIIPAPINAVCWAPVGVIEIANSTLGGYFLDCVEQDSLVNGAKVDAAFQNTVTIYNALGSNSTTTLATDIANANSSLATDITSSITTVGGDISSGITTLALDITGSTTTLATDIGGATTTLATDIGNSTTTLATDLSNVNNTITTEFNTAETNIATDFLTTNTNLANDYTALTNQISALSGQLTQGTALLDAALKQIMKLQLEPEGTQKIVPAILTCTGTNCPNVLNKCPAAGCSWNNVGPLP